MGARLRLGVLAVLAAAPAACTALFPLGGLSGSGDEADADASGEAAPGPEVGGPGDAHGEPGAVDAKPAGDADGALPPEAGGDVVGSKDVSTVDSPPETSVKDAPPDVPPETGGPTYAQVVLQDSPLAYWRLGETSGATTAQDASGHGVNGVYKGNVGLGVKGAIAGDPDTAANFDGATSFVDVGQFLQAGGNAPFSLELWAAPMVDTNYHGLVSRNDSNGPPSEGYLMYVEPSPQPFYDLERLEPPSSKAILQTNFMATSGAWAHVVTTYDGATMAIYVNGNLENTKAATFAVTGATSDFVVGAEGGGSTSWFLGQLDEVAAYDHVLPATHVLAHYHVGVGQPP